MWLFYSLSAAFLEVGKDVYSSKISDKFNNLTKAFSLSVYSLLILIPLLIVDQVPIIDWTPFLLVSLFSIFITPLQLYLYFKSIESSPISESIPMFAFNPIFTLIISFIIDHQLPNWFGFLGVALVSIGIYIARLQDIKKLSDLILPIKRLLTEKGPQYMLGVALTLALGINVGKIRINASSPIMSSFTGIVISTVSLYVLNKIFNKQDFSLKSIFLNYKQLAWLGILNGISRILTGFALQIGYTPYIAAVKRTNIIGSQIAGKYILKEKMTLYKWVGNLVLFMGVLLIVIYK